MKNIKKIGLELIQLEDQTLLVDRKLPVFTDDWALELYNGKSKATTPKWIDDKNNVWWLRRMNMNCPSNDPECIKVVASTKQLEGLPIFIKKGEDIIIIPGE